MKTLEIRMDRQLKTKIHRMPKGNYQLS
jgi:hypothetical protein